MASTKRIVVVLFIMTFVTMSAVQASEGIEAEAVSLAASDAGLGARRALTQWYRFGRGRRNNGRRGGRDYYRDHFENHRGRDGGYDCGEGNSAAAAAAAAAAGNSAASAAGASSACRGYRG